LHVENLYAVATEVVKALAAFSASATLSLLNRKGISSEARLRNRSQSEWFSTAAEILVFTTTGHKRDCLRETKYKMATETRNVYFK
jgi:hypothetical protein